MVVVAAGMAGAAAAIHTMGTTGTATSKIAATAIVTRPHTGLALRRPHLRRPTPRHRLRTTPLSTHSTMAPTPTRHTAATKRMCRCTNSGPRLRPGSRQVLLLPLLRRPVLQCPLRRRPRARLHHPLRLRPQRRRRLLRLALRARVDTAPYVYLQQNEPLCWLTSSRCLPLPASRPRFHIDFIIRGFAAFGETA